MPCKYFEYMTTSSYTNANRHTCMLSCHIIVPDGADDEGDCMHSGNGLDKCNQYKEKTK